MHNYFNTSIIRSASYTILLSTQAEPLSAKWTYTSDSKNNDFKNYKNYGPTSQVWRNELNKELFAIKTALQKLKKVCNAQYFTSEAKNLYCPNLFLKKNGSCLGLIVTEEKFIIRHQLIRLERSELRRLCNVYIHYTHIFHWRMRSLSMTKLQCLLPGHAHSGVFFAVLLRAAWYTTK